MPGLNSGQSWTGVAEAGLVFAAAVLVLGLSIAGLVVPHTVFASEHLQIALRPNDAANLIVVMPALVLAYLLRAGLTGRLLLGAVALTFVYNSLASLLSMGSGWVQSIHILIVLTGSAAALLNFLNAEAQRVRPLAEGRWTLRWPGIVLALFGLAFGARAVGLLMTGEPLPQTEFALSVTDLVFALLWTAAGVAMWFKRPRGLWAAGAFLFQAGLLFVGLIVILLLQPVFNGTVLNMEDLVVSAIMAALFAVPVIWFVLSLRFAK